MNTDIRVKICGLSTPETIDAAANAGASYVGFVFFPKSPRYVDYARARDLALHVPDGIAKVALVVNADNAMLDQLTAEVPLDMLQLHGSETPERVQDIKSRYGLPVMKAVGIAEASDLPQLALYEAVADQLLVDTKPPKDADRPGGNAETFDWELIAGRDWARPWMLAGGLTQENVAQAIAQTGARQIDLSSGVERAPGVKDPDLIAGFIKAAQCS